MKKGKVYLIGAGPGDWELISIKGLQRIKQADVIMYDFLASQKLLTFAKKKAQVICVGKSDGMHLLEQSQINKLLYQKAKAGKVVARLKGGDPMLFSHGIEEALFLKKRDIDFEIIPGITSAFSAPASFGIPLTRKGKYSSVAVLTGRKSSGKPLDAPACDTLIYLMAVSTIQRVVKTILASGRSETTPCALIERATTSGERMITGNLSNIVARAKRFCVRPPAVFVVGKVVAYGKRINDYTNKN
ncbi:MAG: uroporphyrinogen-III C-methyltransferase [Candidatus Omnitrophica bacterium]|nr:uroporphyrinogen-III C-methyltransferase [Candidatus Omnitrophota bacterium]